MKAPAFSLKGVDGKTHTLDSIKGAKATIIVFSCNHCPYVTGSQERLNRLYGKYEGKGVALVGINSNETVNHPTDSFGGINHQGSIAC